MAFPEIVGSPVLTGAAWSAAETAPATARATRATSAIFTPVRRLIGLPDAFIVSLPSSLWATYLASRLTASISDLPRKSGRPYASSRVRRPLEHAAGLPRHDPGRQPRVCSGTS